MINKLQTDNVGDIVEAQARKDCNDWTDAELYDHVLATLVEFGANCPMDIYAQAAIFELQKRARLCEEHVAALSKALADAKRPIS